MRENKNILVSFSGGKTSAYMAQRMKTDPEYDDYNLFFVFANTGQENEETLRFVDKCDKEFNLGVVWVESDVIFGQRVGSKHKVVNQYNASRKGEPFEDVIKKYGLPNKSFPHCTRELKLNPINSWAKDNIDGKYDTAIGIRIDENRRAKNDPKIFYPLIEWKIDKDEVNEFWENQKFTLELEEHQGNCSWCFKKSLKKHLRLIKENPEIFDFPRRMEKEYCNAGAGDMARVIFRHNRSTNDMFKIYADSQLQMSIFDFNEDDGCSESCEFVEMG